MSAAPIELPHGIEHGTPEGFSFGCRTEKQCPALLTHGMCCLYAHLRSTTDPRYYRAKVRDPRPAAIAARLGIRPPRLAAVAEEAAVDEAFANAPADYRWKKRAARQKEPAAAPTPETIEPAQPLAEQSQDPEPQEDAATPAIEEETPAEGTSVVEGEDMGHPPTTTTTEEPTVTDTAAETDTPPTELEQRCAEAIATGPGRKKIRDWAASQGFEVARTGRIPALFVRSYVVAQYPELADQLHDEIAQPAPVEDLVVELVAEYPEPDVGIVAVDDSAITEGPVVGEEKPGDGFRPDWAGVTIPEDVRDARNTAARLEEDNARLSSALAFVLRRLEHERAVHAADDVLHHALIKGLQDKLSIASTRNALLDRLVRQAQASEFQLRTTVRQLRAQHAAAPKPFWRRRR